MLTVILLSMAVFLSSCVSCNISGETSGETPEKDYYEAYPVPAPEASICILYSDTEFKKELVTALVEEFNIKEISVTVDSILKSSQYSLTDYDATILLSCVQGFRPLPEAVEYIKAHNYSDSIIYFSTYERFNIPYGLDLDKNKIDAITSASPLSDREAFEEVKNKIIAAVMEVLELN